MFIAALFTIAKLWKQSRYFTTDEWFRIMCIYIQWNFIQTQRRMKFWEYSKMAARGRKQKACLLKWNLGETLETHLAGKTTEKRQNFDPSTPPACTEHLYFTLNGETRRAPGTVNKQAGLEKAGATAHPQQPGAGKLVKAAVGGKLHRRAGKTHFPVSCKQTRRPEKAGAVSPPPVCLERGKLEAEARAQENSE
jgi:hypothetical protein